MKSSALILLTLAATSCAAPRLPDPRFDFPAAPKQLQTPVPPLQTIEPPKNKVLELAD